MSTDEDTGRKLARGRAVDEAFETLQKYQVDRRRVVFFDEDHKRAGGYGVVRRAHLYPSSYLPQWLTSRRYGPPQVVAVKEIKMSSIYNMSELKRAFTKEVMVWSGVEGHPNIARFIGFCADFRSSEAWLISPWESCGNISDFIRGRELEVPEKLSLVYDTINALTFLHQLNPPVCHGDIKSANVLVNSESRAVLCDFGLARLHEDSGFGRLETTTGFKGSIRWCSPELLDGHPRTPSSDVFAWAWLVWEIMTGEMPYEGAGADYVIIRKIFESPRLQVNGESRLGDCLQLWELMIRCWAAVPSDRPTSAMCKIIVAYLPHCPPVPKGAGSHNRSAALLENLGELESWRGNHKAAFARLEQALSIYEEQGDDRGIASVLRKQAAVSYRDSNYLRLAKAAAAAVEKFRSLGDANGVADALYWMGVYFVAQDNMEKALPHLQDSLEIFRAEENTVGIGQCLERLGELYRRQMRLEEASSTLEEAVDIASRCGDKLGEARALIVLGVTRWGLDDLNDVMSTLSKAYEIARSIGWEHGVTTALCRMGGVAIDQGDHPEAERLLRESVSVARRSDAGWRLVQALHYLARCLEAQDRLEEATPIMEESWSLEQAIGVGHDPSFAFTCAFLARGNSDRGYKESALLWFDRAITHFRKGHNMFNVSKYLAEKGLVLVDMGRCDEGALHFEASMMIDRELGNDEDVAWNLGKLSGIPKTTIKWEIRRQARLTLAKAQSQRTPSLLCDVMKLQLRVPQLTTPNLRSSIKLL